LYALYFFNCFICSCRHKSWCIVCRITFYHKIKASSTTSVKLFQLIRAHRAIMVGFAGYRIHLNTGWKHSSIADWI
jgi:hypothetical protein